MYTLVLRHKRHINKTCWGHAQKHLRIHRFFLGFLCYMQLVGTSTFPWHPKVPRHPKVPWHPKVPKLMPQRWLKRWASFGCHGAGWSSPAVLVGWSSVVALLGDGCWWEIALSFNRALLFVSRFLLTSDLGCSRFWGGVFPQRFGFLLEWWGRRCPAGREFDAGMLWAQRCAGSGSCSPALWLVGLEWHHSQGIKSAGMYVCIYIYTD